MSPRTCGLSFSSRMSLILLSPSALTDRRWTARVPRRPLTSRTLRVPPSTGALVANMFPLVLAMVEILDLLAALGRDVGRRMHFRQAAQGRANQVDRVARTHGLGQHVLHADRLEHGAYRAAGDH